MYAHLQLSVQMAWGTIIIVVVIIISIIITDVSICIESFLCFIVSDVIDEQKLSESAALATAQVTTSDDEENDNHTTTTTTSTTTSNDDSIPPATASNASEAATALDNVKKFNSVGRTSRNRTSAPVPPPDAAGGIDQVKRCGSVGARSGRHGNQNVVGKCGARASTEENSSRRAEHHGLSGAQGEDHAQESAGGHEIERAVKTEASAAASKNEKTRHEKPGEEEDKEEAVEDIDREEGKSCYNTLAFLPTSSMYCPETLYMCIKFHFFIDYDEPSISLKQQGL